MSSREQELLDATQRATKRLKHMAAQYCNGEPLEIIQLLMFRSFIQEAHLYAVLDQLATGKLDNLELQRRFVDHAFRIADDIRNLLTGSKIISPKGGNG